MSKWKVTGLRTEQVFCFVEANSEEEAMEKASDSFSYDEEEVSAWTIDAEKEYYTETPPEICSAEEV